MLELYLVRNPKTKSNNNLIVQGSLDILPEVNEQKLEGLVQELTLKGDFDMVLSSTLLRSKIPAQKIAEYLQKKQGNQQSLKYFPLQEIVERNLGCYEGVPYNQIPCKTQNPQNQLEYLFFLEGIPNGESLGSVRERIKKFHGEYIKNCSGKIIVIGHLFWINYYINYLVWGDVASGIYRNIKNFECVALSIDVNAVKKLYRS